LFETLINRQPIFFILLCFCQTPKNIAFSYFDYCLSVEILIQVTAMMLKICSWRFKFVCCSNGFAFQHMQ